MSDLGWPLERAARAVRRRGRGGRRRALGHVRRARARAWRALGLGLGRRARRLPRPRTRSRTWSAGSGVPAFGQGARRPQLPARRRGAGASWSEDAELEALIADDPRGRGARTLGVPSWSTARRSSAGPRGRARGVDEDALAAISYTGGTTGHAEGRDAQPPQPARQRAPQPRRRPATRRTTAGCTCARCSTSRARRTCSPARGWAREQVMLPRFEPAAVLEAIERERHHAHRASSRRCSRCCSTRRAPTPPTSRPAPPPVRGVADLARAAAARARAAAGLRRRPVLRDDRGGADGHPPLARGPPPRREPARSMGAPVPGRAGRGARRRAASRRAVGPRAERDARLLEPARTRRPRRSSTAGTAPATSSREDERRLPLHGRPRQGHDHHRRRERLLGRGRGGAAASTRPSTRPRCSASPTSAGARPSTPSSSRARRSPPKRCSSTAAPPIAGFKVPRAIELRDEPLPKSGAGKVLKNQLREPFWAGRERRVN